jgi:predicted ArsR family transcriptional regulator
MDELEAVGDPNLRETLLWVRAEARPVNADQLAAAHEVHRNVARSRLDRLAKAGLLTASFERRTGRSGPGAGRPAKVYAVAPGLDAIEFPARRYESLLGLVVAGLPVEGRAETLRGIGVEFGRELAQTARLRPAKRLATGLDRMCAAVRSLGYQAAVAEVTENSAVIASPTCPLRPLVRTHPEVAEIDRGMWAGLAATALAGSDVVDVNCETRDCLEDHAACRVFIELRARPKRQTGF